MCPHGRAVHLVGASAKEAGLELDAPQTRPRLLVGCCRLGGKSSHAFGHHPKHSIGPRPCAVARLGQRFVCGDVGLVWRLAH